MSQATAKDDLHQPELIRPTAEHGAAVRSLIRACKPLDVNSTYAYLLLGHLFGDTCVLALDGERPVGFVSGFRAPPQPDTLFVWQVAVHPDMRGSGLALRMMNELLGRDALRGVTRVETTVSPSNTASLAFFHSLARRLHAPVEERPLFSADMFGKESHEEERLITIGPFTTQRTFHQGARR